MEWNKKTGNIIKINKIIKLNKRHNKSFKQDIKQDTILFKQDE